MSSQTLVLYKSSVAKKFVMGLTGLGLCGFVLAHMSGNILIFKGAEAYNMYGHLLTSNPAYPLISYGLLAILVLHVLCAISLSYENKQARSQGYAVSAGAEKAASLASKTMIASGSITAVFVVLHLLTFKYGTLYTVSYNGQEVRDLFRLVVEVFQSPVYVIGYTAALFFLGLHLSHGFSAAFQSIGFGHPRWSPMIKCLAVLYAIVVAGGFIAQPLYVYFVH